MRVKSKFKTDYKVNPIILPKFSRLTVLLVTQAHEVCGHGGAYAVLKEVRKEFYVVNFFSVVRKILKKCVTCRRYNARPIKINTNAYRKTRVAPGTTPFSDVYVDHMGPFFVNLQGQKVKVWILVLTCMFTRGVNLIICRSLDTESFLKAVQQQIFSFGIFRYCVSDLGSSIKSGGSIIQSFLNDMEVKSFLESKGIECVEFTQYPKGNSSLGALVENCVKQSKLLIHKAIRTVVLDYFDFDLLICKVISIINKRPICFQRKLSSLELEECPLAISPEMMIKGYETNSLNVVPSLQSYADEDDSPDYSNLVSETRSSYSKLVKVKDRLLDLYHTEFLTNLIGQAVDKSDRYRPVPHERLHPGDIVLLVEKNTKRYLYPMGRVLSVEVNELNESTAARVLKGDTREVVYRHATSLILLLSTGSSDTPLESPTQPGKNNCQVERSVRPKRASAEKCRSNISQLIQGNLV